MKRLLFLNDTHCGHWSGLTPPEYRVAAKRNRRWYECQKLGWTVFKTVVKSWQPIDVVAMVGDLVDGRQEKQGGQELLAASTKEQAAMAIRCVKEIKPRLGSVGVYGTPYHTGQLTEVEDLIFDGVDTLARGDSLQFKVDDVLVNIKHKIGGTSTPTGGDIALRKEMLWTKDWAYEHGFEVPDLIVRGHVHRYRMVCDMKQTAMTLPSLQMWTTFGSRQCSGMIHWGLVAVDIEGSEIIRWNKYSLELKQADFQETVQL